MRIYTQSIPEFQSTQFKIYIYIYYILKPAAEGRLLEKKFGDNDLQIDPAAIRNCSDFQRMKDALHDSGLEALQNLKGP